MWIKLNKLIVNTERCVYFERDILHMVGNVSIDIDKEDYEKLKKSLVKEVRRVQGEKPQDLVELFERLHKLTKGRGRVIFTPARERKLKELMTKHRMTEEDIIRAATNIGNDEFLQGKNDNNKRYGDIDYLLRHDKAARWAEEQVQKKRGMF